MPAAIPIVATVVAAAMGASTTVVAIVGLVGSIVAGALSRSMLDEPTTPARGSRDLTRGIRANTRSTNRHLPVLYGKMRVGGNVVFMESTGTSNQDLWMVVNLAEGECEGIEQDTNLVDQIWLGDKLWNQYGGNVQYWFHSGTATQTYDTNLNTAIPKWQENQHYTCYMVFKLTYNRDYFQRVPNITVLLKGRKVYDFRDGQTKWSDNPVLCLYDYMTNTRYGMGFDSSKFDTTSWTSAANYCDTKGWKLNFYIDRDMPAADILDAILTTFRGQMVWYDGKFYLRYADLNYESPVATINDEHVLQKEDGVAALAVHEPSRFDVPDALRVRFIDADKGYVEDTVMVGDVQGVIKEVTLEGVTDRQLASKIGTYLLERFQLDRTIVGTFRADMFQLEPHDVITFNSSALAISNQTMRVQSAEILPDGLVKAALMYEDTTLYDDVYNISTEDIYDVTLPDPSQEPPSVGNVQVAEETYYYRLRNFTKLKITFDPPSNYPWFDHVEVWISFDNTNWKHMFNATNDFEIPNVQEGDTYYIRLKTVNIWGTKQQDANDFRIQHTVAGYTQVPSSVSALDAVVNQNTVNLYAARVNDPDIELYEFRLGSSWSGGIFLAALRAPNLSLYGVKPGNHTFSINTLSTNGQYGDTPRLKSVSLKDPPDGWTVQTTYNDDYGSGGTHQNTEQTLYNSEYYLKCSHGSAGLTGTYRSPVYDLGASGRYMVYVLADVVVTGAGTTWDDIVPNTSAQPNTTWQDINADTRTWAEITELSTGPQVKMRLYYGETNPPQNVVERLEILSAIVTGRYFQVEIEITDPSDVVYALVQNYTLKFCQ